MNSCLNKILLFVLAIAGVGQINAYSNICEKLNQSGFSSERGIAARVGLYEQGTGLKGEAALINLSDKDRKMVLTDYAEFVPIFHRVLCGISSASDREALAGLVRRNLNTSAVYSSEVYLASYLINGDVETLARCGGVYPATLLWVVLIGTEEMQRDAARILLSNYTEAESGELDFNIKFKSGQMAILFNDPIIRRNFLGAISISDLDAASGFIQSLVGGGADQLRAEFKAYVASLELPESRKGELVKLILEE